MKILIDDIYHMKEELEGRYGFIGYTRNGKEISTISSPDDLLEIAEILNEVIEKRISGDQNAVV